MRGQRASLWEGNILSTALAHEKHVVNTGFPVDSVAGRAWQPWGWGTAAPATPSSMLRGAVPMEPQLPHVYTQEINTSPANGHFPAGCPSLAPAGPHGQVCCSLSLFAQPQRRGNGKACGACFPQKQPGSMNRRCKEKTMGKSK